MPFVMVCPEDQFNVETQTCAAPAWALFYPGGLPPLTIAEGLQIGGAILSVWAIAYVVRVVRTTVSGRGAG